VRWRVVARSRSRPPLARRWRITGACDENLLVALVGGGLGL
jgi:hypothetical protein